MPIYTTQGKKYNIPTEKVDSFLKAFPEAVLGSASAVEKDITPTDILSQFEAYKASPDKYRDTKTDATQQKLTPALKEYLGQHKIKRPTQGMYMPGALGGGGLVIDEEVDDPEVAKQLQDFLLNTPSGRQHYDDYKKYYEEQKKLIGSNVDKLRKDVDELRKAHKEKYGALGSSMGANIMEWMFNPSSYLSEDDPTNKAISETRKIRQAERELKKAENLLKAINDGDENALSQFAKEFGRDTGDMLVDAGSFGIIPLTDALTNKKTVDSIIEKKKKGEDLSRSEELILSSLATNQAAQEIFGEDLTVAQQAAQGITQSIPFMISFIPLAKAAKGMTGWLAAIGREAIEGSLKGFAKNVSKVGLKAADITARSTIMSIMDPHTVSVALENMDGQTGYEVTDEGLIRFTGKEDTMSFAKAYGKAIVTQTIENFSEHAGAAFSRVGRWIDKGMYGGNITLLAKMFSDRQGGFWKGVQSIMKKAGWHGIPEEFLEEQLSTVLNAIITGDSKWSDLLDPEQQLVTFITVAAIGSGSAAIGTAGYGIRRAKIKADFSRTSKEWERMFGKQADDFKQIIDQGSMEEKKITLISMLVSDLSDEEKRTVLNYYVRSIRHQAMQGAKKGEKEKATEGIQDAVQDLVNADMGGIVTVKVSGKEIPLQTTKGSIVLNEEGKIDRDKSSQEIYVKGEDGKISVVPLSHIEEVVEIVPQQEAVDAVTETITSEIEAAQQNEEVRPYEQGEIVSFDMQGTRIAGQILSKNEDGTYSVMVDGIGPMPIEPRQIINEDHLQGLDNGSIVEYEDENGTIRKGEIKDFYGMRQQGRVDIDGIAVPMENIIGAVEETAENAPEQPTGETETQKQPIESSPVSEETDTTEKQAEQAELSQIETIITNAPKQKNGEIDYDALLESDPESFAALYENEEGAEETVKELTSVSENIGKKIEAAKKKLENADSINKRKAAKKEVSEQEERKKRIDSIIDKYTPQESTPLSGRREERAQSEISQQGEAFSLITERWSKAPKTEGAEDIIILPNGKEIRGRYVLTEASAPTPSHNPFNFYEKSEGFPVDEKGNSVNDRDYRNDKKSQTIVEQRAANYDQRAIQTPVVVSNEGVVLSGNDRTMASQIAARNGTDSKYVEYLKNNAERFGVTLEQVNAFKNPRLVFVPASPLPYNAATFAQFNSDEKKSQNKTEQSVKLGKITPAVAVRQLLETINRFDTPSDAYSNAKATREMINALIRNEVININDAAELVDGETLSVQGKDFVENLLVGSALHEDAVRILSEMKDVRQTIVRSLLAIANNSRLGEYSLINELSDAVVLLYESRNYGIKRGENIWNYLLQNNIFGENAAGIYDATVQLLANVLNQRSNKLNPVIESYNATAELPASGQIDLFAGEVMSKDEILTKLLEKHGYTLPEAVKRARRESTTLKTEPTVQSDNGGDGGRGRGTDTPQYDGRNVVDKHNEIEAERNQDSFDFFEELSKDDSPEEVQRKKAEEEAAKEKEADEQYAKTFGSMKRYPKTRKEAIEQQKIRYIDAKAAKEDWESRKYKETKAGVTIESGDELDAGFGKSYSYTELNERRRQRNIRAFENAMKESLEFMEQMGLSRTEVEAFVKSVEKKQAQNSDNSLNFDENTVNERKGKYTTQSGKQLQFEFAEFEEVPNKKDKTHDDRTGTNGVQRQKNPLQSKLGRLREGEFALVERIFTEKGHFSFTGAEKIETMEDVVAIFDKLEDAAIENSFAVYVKNGVPTVQHLGMGGFHGTNVNVAAMSAAIDRIKPDAIYFVHNHPSGALRASPQDAVLLGRLREAFGDKVQDGIIINLKTGKYGVFEPDAYSSVRQKTKPKENAVPIKVFTFDKLVFGKDYDPELLHKITNSKDVASFISSHRLGDRKKISFLVINRGGRVIGNFFTNATEITARNAEELANYMTEKVITYGGSSVIIYGSLGSVGKMKASVPALEYIRDVMAKKSQGELNLLDAISIRNDMNYESYGDKGLMEPETEYSEKNELREPRLQAISPNGFYSTVENSLGKISQPKGSPDQFKAMMLKNGAKQAELDWMGWDDFTRDKKSITKEDIQQWIDENRIEIEEVEKGKSARVKSIPRGEWVNNLIDDSVPEKLNDGGDWVDSNGSLILYNGEESYVDEFIRDLGDYFSSDFISTLKQSENIEITDDTTKYSQYTLPGGENYKELLLTMPYMASINREEVSNRVDSINAELEELRGKGHSAERISELLNERDRLITELNNEAKSGFKSSHFEEPNILAHIRFNERTVNGKRVLFIEEIQSDWAQQGKKEGFKSDKDKLFKELESKGIYQDKKSSLETSFIDKDGKQIYHPNSNVEQNATPEQDGAIDKFFIEYQRLSNASVPNMPFKKTDQWVNLALRRMMMYASENGYDRIAWTTGEQQADRYDLSKQVDKVLVSKYKDGYTLNVLLPGRAYNNEQTLIGEKLTESQLEEQIGKDLTQKVILDNLPLGQTNVYEGIDLKVGGEGMIAFYDKIIPSQANKVGKPFGSKVETISIEDVGDVSSLPITEKMKSSVMENGVPLFQQSQQKFKPISKKKLTKLINRLLKSGLAKSVDVFTAKEFHAELERILGKDDAVRLMALWHGSPHSFKQFSTDFVGSGEGAQAYGWGLYFTELKDVAEWYANKLKSEKHRENAVINKIAKDAIESANGNVEEALKYQRSLLNEEWSDKKRVRATIKVIESGKPLNEGKSNLYKIAPPAENMSFVRWDESVSKEQITKIKEQAVKENLKDRWGHDMSDKGKYPNSIPFSSDIDGQTLYRQLMREFDMTPKQASQFLQRAGIDGIQYPAESRSSDKARGFNYVMFDAESVSITDKIRLMEDSKGTVYGFVTNDGRIVLNGDMMNSNTPIHEFGHLWNSFIKKNNPELWNKGVELIKESEYWKQVNENPAYSHLSEESKIDEAIASAIGDKGEIIVNKSIKEQFIDWLDEVWEKIKKVFGVKPDVSIQEMTLDKFTDLATDQILSGEVLTDVSSSLEGFSKQEISEMEKIKQAAIADNTFMKAPNGNPTNLNERQWLQVRTSNFKKWFGDWQNDPENASKVVDENGEPMVVYHGTNAEFNEFMPNRRGLWFTQMEGRAVGYAKNRSIDKGSDIVIGAFLNIKNPADSEYNNEYILFGDRGFDGWISRMPDGRMFTVVASEPNQIKSATDNTGGFSTNSNDIRLQSVADVAKQTGSTMTEEVRDDLDRKISNIGFKFKEIVQDNYLAVARVQNLLRERGLKISEFDDYYLQVTHLNGKNDAQLEHYNKHYQRPMIKAIKNLMNSGFSYRDVENYAMLKHGIERNEYYNEVNDTTDKEYSGVSAIEEEIKKTADEFIQEFEDACGSDKIENFWEKVNAATNNAMRRQFEGGKIDRATYEDIMNRYKYYVPLRGHDAVTAEDKYDYSPDMGVYFVNALAKVNGRTSRAESPFAYIYSMNLSSIGSSNRNVLNQAFLRLARKDKSGLLTVNKVWYEKIGENEDQTPIYEPRYPEYSSDIKTYQKNIEEFDARMAKLEEEGRAIQKKGKLNLNGLFIKPRQASQHAVHVSQNGTEYVVYINGNPAVARAINRDNVVQPGKALQTIATASRFMAANFTMRNPSFVLSNFMRDYLYASNTLLVKEDVRYALRFQKNIPHAAMALQRYLRGKSDMSVKYDKYMVEYIMNGGKTGFSHMVELQRVQKQVEREIKNIDGKRGLRVVMDWIATANDFAENLTRLSTYIASRESGRSVVKSISDAKEVTVNFNRSGAGGEYANVFRSSYLFVNAGIQGIANFGKIAAKNPGRASALIGAYIATGMLFPILTGLMGGDDGMEEYFKLTDWERQNNFCLYTGKGFIKIPIPHELRVFHNMGDNIYTMITGQRDVTSGMIDILAGFSDLVPGDPSGAFQASWAELMPDATKPLFQLATNRSFTGRKIRDEWADEYKPGYLKAKTNKRGETYVPDFLVALAKAIDHTTRGDGVSRGFLSANPDVVDHLMRGYFGGLYTVFSQAADVAYKAGDYTFGSKEFNLKLRNTPLKSFYADKADLRANNSMLNGRYSEIVEKAKESRSLLNRYQEQVKSGELTMNDFLKKVDKKDLRQGVAPAKAINAIKKRESELKHLTKAEQIEAEEIIRREKKKVVDQYYRK